MPLLCASLRLRARVFELVALELHALAGKKCRKSVVELTELLYGNKDETQSIEPNWAACVRLDDLESCVLENTEDRSRIQRRSVTKRSGTYRTRLLLCAWTRQRRSIAEGRYLTSFMSVLLPYGPVIHLTLQPGHALRPLYPLRRSSAKIDIIKR